MNNGLIGNASNNVLDGGAGADTLQGGQGNDSLIGGVGNDTYTFALGWGNDTLTDYDIAANSDLVSFGAGITSSAMTFKQVGNDLICSGPGGTDSITIKNWYLGSANQIEQFAFADGTILSASQISGLVTSMALATKGSTVSTDSIGHASTTNNNSLAGPDRKYGGDAGYHIMSSESPPVFTDDAIADGFAHPFLELTSTPSFVTPASHPHQTDIGMTSRTMMADPSGHIFPFEPSPGLYDDAAGASPPTLAGFPWDQSPSSIPWYEVGDDLTRTHRLVELMAGMGGSSVEPGYRNLPQYDHAHSWIP